MTDQLAESFGDVASRDGPVESSALTDAGWDNHTESLEALGEVAECLLGPFDPATLRREPCLRDRNAVRSCWFGEPLGDQVIAGKPIGHALDRAGLSDVGNIAEQDDLHHFSPTRVSRQPQGVRTPSVPRRQLYREAHADRNFDAQAQGKGEFLYERNTGRLEFTWHPDDQRSGAEKRSRAMGPGPPSIAKKPCVAAERSAAPRAALSQSTELSGH